MTTTPEQRAEWQELEKAATEGPWETTHGENPGDIPVLAGGNYLCTSPDDGVRGGHNRVDAEFIAASREAVPALLDEVERQAEVIRRVRALHGAYEHLVENRRPEDSWQALTVIAAVAIDLRRALGGDTDGGGS